MASLQEQFMIDAKGRKTQVIPSLRRYQKMMEDLHDLAIVAERRSEEPIPLHEMKRRLRQDGNPQSRSEAL
jgi:hypothetical protein